MTLLAGRRIALGLWMSIGDGRLQRGRPVRTCLSRYRRRRRDVGLVREMPPDVLVLVLVLLSFRDNLLHVLQGACTPEDITESRFINLPPLPSPRLPALSALRASMHRVVQK